MTASQGAVAVLFQLPLHWPCTTDSVVYPSVGSMA